MADRRSFIAGALAAGMMPATGWAAADSPAYLSAALRADGVPVLCGLTAAGRVTFEHALPARGHAAAAHPHRAEAVAFARRPGTYALVLDCRNGEQRARLHAPEGRHFYGHGAFSGDGDLLFTTENDYNAGRGVIGVWDARRSYRRIAEFASGGIGPHDIRLMPDGATLVVANGGIETHPDTGRAKLNLPLMRSSLCYMDLNGRLAEQVTLDAIHQRNSIRHLAVSQDGAVAFAMQWQGDLNADLPLLGIHERGQGTPRLAMTVTARAMRGYLGSIALSAGGTQVAITSPREGRLMVLRRGDLDLVRDEAMDDVCGVAAAGTSFMVTSGQGLARDLNGQTTRHRFRWDNHLVSV